MIAIEDTILVLLAAGRGTRFGGAEGKLRAPFLDRPLGQHIAATLATMPFRARVAVTGAKAPDYAADGYRLLVNEHPEEGMGRSVRIGVAHARDAGAGAVLIVLADMPRVTATHVRRLFDAAEGPAAVVASSDGIAPKPPALFGRDRFDALMMLEGDEGARDLLRAGRQVVTEPAELVDVDTPEELERLRQLVHAPDTLTRVGARRSG